MKKILILIACCFALSAYPSAIEDLFSAVEAGNVKKVQKIIKKNSDMDINSQDDLIGNSVLMRASTRGNLDIVKILVEAGADVNLKNTLNSTALSVALTAGHPEVAEFLIDAGAQLDNTSLITAVESNKLDVVKLLIEKDVDVNTKDSIGQTALLSASLRRNLEIIKLLIDAGADLNLPDSVGQTALMLAAYVGHSDTVKLLVEAGADINVKADHYYDSALTVATIRNHPEIAEYLRANGAQE